MSGNNPVVEQAQQVAVENQGLMDQLAETLKAGADAILELRRMLRITYWVVIWLSIIMFALGVLLLLVPLAHGFLYLSGGSSKGDDWQLSAMTGGMGLVDIVTLFLFRPVGQIRRLMGDFSQLTVILNTHQTSVGLRLLESKLEERATVGQAAEHVNTSAKGSLDLIEKYFENNPQFDINRPAEGANPAG
jgi:hypothetical protein